ncbi:thiamine-binding protein [Halorussus sp. GCM10023401]|uniref:thiamine-binding protein n=1 Tax=Halorussus TaxID=1070314 RepID=UPI00360EAB30
MTAIARLEVIPTRERGMSDAVARAVEALDRFDVTYETTATDTVIEADDASEVFAAAEAAHRAVDDRRVVTSLEIDDDRSRRRRSDDRVEAVERRLGRPARREREAHVTARQREATGGERWVADDAPNATSGSRYLQAVGRSNR